MQSRPALLLALIATLTSNPVHSTAEQKATWLLSIA
jgi:hypothetical protein